MGGTLPMWRRRGRRDAAANEGDVGVLRWPFDAPQLPGKALKNPRLLELA